MPKKFQRTIENFICENCQNEVKGNGYTNHCPRCLWSKHVDINPGDRQSKCGGLMQPQNAFWKNQQWYLEHRCLKCGTIRKIKLNDQDNLDVLELIMENNAKKTNSSSN